MKGFLKKLVTRVAKGQGGFTLIEMIVVVGIIAVLAAVIVPNIGKFIGSGEQGAMDAEREAVQTAMNAMMADKSVTTIIAWDLSTSKSSTNGWTDKPTDSTGSAATLDGYLQDSTTVYFYCYDTKGKVEEVTDKSSETC